MELKDYIASYSDFPKRGILFRDFSPLLRDADALAEVVRRFADHFGGGRVDVVAGIEARGFVIATALAARLGTGVVMLRKQGKLPGATKRVDYEIEYGRATMEIQTDALKPAERVLICDDLLATGGTAAGAAELVESVGARVVGFALVMELGDLNGIAKISAYDTQVLIKY